jgi:hypothetical protein
MRKRSHGILKLLFSQQSIVLKKQKPPFWGGFCEIGKAFAYCLSQQAALSLDIAAPWQDAS